LINFDETLIENKKIEEMELIKFENKIVDYKERIHVLED